MKHCCCGLSFLLRHLEYVRYPAVPLEEQVPPHFQDGWYRFGTEVSVFVTSLKTTV